MKKKRTWVPKEIEDEIKVEAGHECTVWTCSEKYGLVKHHIDGDPSNNKKDNIIYLCRTHHKMADDGVITQEQCYMYKKLLKDRLEGKITKKVEKVEETRGKEVEPESFLERAIFNLGKRYVLWRHKDLQADLTKDYIIWGFIGIILWVPIFLISGINILNNIILLYASLISLLIGVLIIASLVIIAKSKCRKCGKNFGIRRVKSFEIGRRKVGKTDYGTQYEVTYENSYRCEFCNYTYKRTEREIETISVD